MKKWAGAHLWLLSQGESRCYAWFKAQDLVGQSPRQGVDIGAVGRSLAQIGEIRPNPGIQAKNGEEETVVEKEVVEEGLEVKKVIPRPKPVPWMGCWNCAELGHRAARCPKAVRPVGCCFACGYLGRTVATCDRCDEWHRSRQTGK